jgi:fused signal recognition particle receptor
MLSFWKKSDPQTPPAPKETEASDDSAAPTEAPKRSWLDKLAEKFDSEASQPIRDDTGEPNEAAALAEAPKQSWLDKLAEKFDPETPPPVLDDTGKPNEAAAPAQAPKQSWLSKLKAGLAKTGAGITTLFVGVKVDEALFEELESALLMADAGVEATTDLITRLRARAKADRIEDGQQLKVALADLLVELLAPLQKPLSLTRKAAPGESTSIPAQGPIVMMIAGVNGAGKTTSIGKLAKYFQAHGKSVLLAAGDTFRAAAREQLAVWGERNGVHVIAQDSGDPAAVVFDAVASAKARRIDVLMADTAGRLPTQLHLMEELKKIRRVIAKAEPGAPHEVLLVIDGNTGQNAIAQVKAFDKAIGLTGLIITKLDGTAKGGVLAAIARVHPVPVYFIGVGEGLDDLQPFDAREFVGALLG